MYTDFINKIQRTTLWWSLVIPVFNADNIQMICLFSPVQQGSNVKFALKMASERSSKYIFRMICPSNHELMLRDGHKVCARLKHEDEALYCWGQTCSYCIQWNF